MKHNNIGNVLMVANYPSDTAYAWWLMEHFWKTIAEWIQQNGGQAYLAYPKITSISETIRSAPIQVVELALPWQTKNQAHKANHFIRNNRIAAIYFTDQSFFKLQYARLRFNGVRRIIIHDHTPGDRPYVGGVKGALKAIRNRLPWVTANYMLCVSELMRQRNMQNGRISGARCIVVQNGIHPVECKIVSNLSLRNKLSVEQNSVLVVTSGRAHPYKRFDFVIKCANSLKELSPELDVVFLLVGDGPAMPELEEMVRRLELQESVRLLGFRDDVRDILCGSDIALHAALGEGFSLSIVEYMSAGLPVLVPDIPSVSQAIQHNETGIIYPKDDYKAVANYLKDLLTNRNRRLKMGREARNQASEKYTLDKCTQDFLRALNLVSSS